MKKQSEAVKHIKELLSNRGLNIPSKKLTLPDGQQWIVFEYRGRGLGIDTVSGIWTRESADKEWQCISMPCTVSGALQAVEYLTSE